MSICLAEPPTAPVAFIPAPPIVNDEYTPPISLDEAYRKMFRPLVSYVMRISGCGHQAAEDVVQDLFVRIVRKHREKFETLRSYRSQQSFLFVGARNGAHDWGRHAQLPVSQAVSLSLLDEDVDAKASPNTMRMRAELEHLLAERHETDIASVVTQRELLHAALAAALGEMQEAARREAVALAILEGATNDDLRDYLAYAGVVLSETATKSLVHRARKRIRAALAETEYDDDTVRAKRENESRDIIHFNERENEGEENTSKCAATTGHARLRSVRQRESSARKAS